MADAGPAPPRLRPLTPRALGVVYWTASALLVAGVLLLPALYLVDLPAWVYSGALLRAELLEATATPLRLAPYPVPNALATLIPAALLGTFSALATGRIVAALLLLAGVVGAWRLGQAADPDAPAPRAAIVASCLVVSSSWWNGYLGFQIGVTLLLWLAAAWVRRGRLSPGATGAASLALFFAHAVPFAAFALAAGLDALHRRDGKTVAALVPSGLLTAGYVLGRTSAPFEAPAAAGGIGQALAYKAYTLMKLGPLERPVGLDGATLIGGPLLWIALAASAAVVLLLVGALAWGTARMPAGGRRRAALMAWILAAAALLMPPFALNVVNPGERVLVVAAVGLLAAVPLGARLLRVLAVVCLLFFADDAAALWAQRAGLSPAERAATYARRAASERAAPVDAAFGTAAADAAERPAERLFRHDVLLHSDLYDAAERRDWSRRTFDSGLLVP